MLAHELGGPTALVRHLDLPERSSVAQGRTVGAQISGEVLGERSEENSIVFAGEDRHGKVVRSRHQHGGLAGAGTTEEIQKRAVNLLTGLEIDDLDGGMDTLRGFRSLRRGPEPTVTIFDKESEEARFIVETVQSWLASAPAAAICVAARTNSLLRERYARILEPAGIPTMHIEPDPESEASRSGVRLATMHRMKGLEFSRVLLAGVQDGVIPATSSRSASDPEAQHRREHQERCLLDVAATRARDALAITGFGRASALLRAA